MGAARLEGRDFWLCLDCEEEFAPVRDFERQMEVSLTALAWVIDKIAKMNGVPDATVDAAVATSSGGGDGADQEVPEHPHQYGADLAECVICGHSPFLGKD